MLLPWSERVLHRYETSAETPFGTWIRRWRSRAILAVCVWTISGAVGTSELAAQETLRSSLSQQLVSQFQPDRPAAFLTPTGQLVQQFQRELQPSLLNVGPVRGQLGAGLGVSWDDNANLTNTDRQSEVRFTQSLGLSLNLPLSYLNRIGLQVGATLTEVVTSGKGNTSQAGVNNAQARINNVSTQPFDISIQPGTNISFQFIVGDVLVGVHDYLSVLQDPTQDPAVANQSALGRVTNDAGISALWNLDKLVLSGSFDYSYSSDQSSDLGGGDRNTLRPGVSAGFALSPQLTTGLDTTYTYSTSSGSGTLNAVAIGPFIRGQLTHAIGIDVQGGFYYINASGINASNVNASGVNVSNGVSNGIVVASNVPSTDYYLTIALSHQLTRNIQYLVSFTRDISFSTGNDLTENNNFTLGAGWNLGRNLVFSTSGLANIGRVLSGEFPGNFSQYGVNLQLGWAPSSRIKTAFSYEFLVRNGAGGSYKQNRVDLTVGYNF